jgi:hypothetical protein
MIVSLDNGKTWTDVGYFGFVSAVAPDDDGVWIAGISVGTGGFFGGGADRYNIETTDIDATLAPHESSEGIFTIWTNQDSIWAGERLRNDAPNDTKAVSASFDNGKTWKRFGRAEGLLDTEARAIGGNQNSVWVATSNGINLSFDQGSTWQNYTAREAVTGLVKAIWVDASGDVWLGTSDGLLRALPHNYVSISNPLSSALYAIWTHGNDIWAGSGTGLSLSHDGGLSWQTLSSTNGFPTGSVNSIWGNGSGMIVTGMYDGLSISYNSGMNWNYVEAADIIPSHRAGSVIAVSGDTMTNRIYAVVYGLAGTSNWTGWVQLFYSDDGGSSWNEGGYIYEEGYGLEIGDPFKMIAVNDLVWVANWGNTIGLRKSANGGKDWITVGREASAAPSSELGRSLAWDGTRLWAGGTSLAYTTDDGANWSYVTSWNTAGSTVDAIAADGDDVWVISEVNSFTAVMLVKLAKFQIRCLHNSADQTKPASC